MSNLILYVNELITPIVGWVADFADAITTNPLLLLFCVAIPVAGLGVGFLNRLIRVG